jgi:hypothetical protein
MFHELYLETRELFLMTECINIKTESTIHNEEKCDVCLSFKKEEFVPYSSHTCIHPGSCQSLQSLQ